MLVPRAPVSLRSRRNLYRLTHSRALITVESLARDLFDYRPSMAKAPLRYQFYAIGAILVFTAVIAGSMLGIRAGLGALYVQPACEQACATHGASASDIEFRAGKQDRPSMCVCSNGLRLVNARADTVGTLSMVVPMFMPVLAIFLIARWLRKRRRGV